MSMSVLAAKKHLVEFNISLLYKVFYHKKTWVSQQVVLKEEGVKDICTVTSFKGFKFVET